MFEDTTLSNPWKLCHETDIYVQKGQIRPLVWFQGNLSDIKVSFYPHESSPCIPIDGGPIKGVYKKQKRLV